MGCIYSNFDGDCNMFDEEDVERRPSGCDKEGGCMADNDPDPSWCEYYESDSTCGSCGADFNQDEECTCETDEE